MNKITKAVIVHQSRKYAPFDDTGADAYVLDAPWRVGLERTLVAAGLEVVSSPPPSQAYLLISDRTWITPRAVQRFIETATAPARLKITDEGWLSSTMPLQRLDEVGLYEVGLVPAGDAAQFVDLPAVEVDMQMKSFPIAKERFTFGQGALDSLIFTDAAVHQIDHWTHVLRINWYALAAEAAAEVRKFKAGGLFSKLAYVLGLAWRARTLRRRNMLRGLNQVGARCRIHPTAVVEMSRLGDDVEIGPYAVVRGSYIGSGTRIGEYSLIKKSVLGDKCTVGARATSNLSVFYPGARFAAGNGYQACVVGQDAFLAWTAGAFDLCFSGPVKVMDEGERVSSGSSFLGAAIGHRAQVGGRVMLGYGAEVPSDGVLVAPIDDVVRRWEPGDGPHRAEEGIARAIAPAQEER